MRCSRCDLDLGDMKARAAYLCYELAGDEVIESYWPCTVCDGFMVERYHDRFMGGDSIESAWRSTAAAAPTVARFRECPDPSNKRCRCAVHQEFGH